MGERKKEEAGDRNQGEAEKAGHSAQENAADLFGGERRKETQGEVNWGDGRFREETSESFAALRQKRNEVTAEFGAQIQKGGDEKAPANILYHEKGAMTVSMQERPLRDSLFREREKKKH